MTHSNRDRETVLLCDLLSDEKKPDQEEMIQNRHREAVESMMKKSFTR